MIDRYGPFAQTTSLRQVMDRLLEDALVAPRNGARESWSHPALDVSEEGESLVIEAYVPGLAPEDLEVSVERGILTISGAAPAEQAQNDRHYLMREQRTGRFVRSLQLPNSYTSDPCEATYRHGVLRLVFPKSEDARPRRIQLQTSTQPAMTAGQPEASAEKTAA